ncbi:uncharacterized protein LOC134202366 [Armigeres subalbatus]|uniref:uncharacterized protein LOC134202366 n=1 Tax=Armigeres subalbatus TaxID=124917 RepID=UPI002ED52D7C
MILVLKRDAARKSSAYKKLAEKVLGDATQVRVLCPVEVIQCQGLDKITEAGELEVALRDQCGVEIKDTAIRLRKGYAGTQVALFQISLANPKEVLPCATDADCNSLQNTTCIDIESSSTKTCRCEDMEFPNLGHCWLLNKDLNSLCSGAQDCYTHGNDRDSVDCIESKCKCQLGYFVDEESSSCQEIEYPGESGSLEIANLCLLLFTCCLAAFSLYKLVCLIKFSKKLTQGKPFVL